MLEIARLPLLDVASNIPHLSAPRECLLADGASHGFSLSRGKAKDAMCCPAQDQSSLSVHHESPAKQGSTWGKILWKSAKLCVHRNLPSLPWLQESCCWASRDTFVTPPDWSCLFSELWVLSGSSPLSHTTSKTKTKSSKVVLLKPASLVVLLKPAAETNTSDSVAPVPHGAPQSLSCPASCCC